MSGDTCAILHVTTVHRRDDARIRGKELATLMQAWPERSLLLVADGLGSSRAGEARGPVADVGVPPGGRIGRAVVGGWRVVRYVRRLRPIVVHFHDPELILPGLVLSVLGYRVVYDIHEDVPRQILAKPWLPRLLRRPMAGVFGGLEWVASRLLTGIVAATPEIARRFPADRTVVVQNFPVLSELVTADRVPYAQRPADFAYVGTIETIRGAREMVRAVGAMAESSRTRLQLAGPIRPSTLETEMRDDPAWSRVVFHGWATRGEVATILGRVRAGLVVLHPVGGYTESWPVKMFEYMAAGLPVIASDFPLWRKIIDGAQCGLLVDPADPEAIAAAMQWVLDHPEEAERMGERGRAAVRERYNWDREAVKLLDFYQSLVPTDGEGRGE